MNPSFDIDKAGLPGIIEAILYPGAKSTIGCGGADGGGTGLIGSTFACLSSRGAARE